jgi:hypothetical protein
MKKNQEIERVKMNLAFDKEFYDFIKVQADLDYMKVATWITRFLKMNLLDGEYRVRPQMSTNTESSNNVSTKDLSSDDNNNKTKSV